jgi:hypothetical protein
LDALVSAAHAVGYVAPLNPVSLSPFNSFADYMNDRTYSCNLRAIALGSSAFNNGHFHDRTLPSGRVMRNASGFAHCCSIITVLRRPFPR